MHPDWLMNVSGGDKRYEPAATTYEAALSNRAAVEIELGDYPQAVKDSDLATRRAPANALMLSIDCWANGMNGTLDAALAACNKSLDLRSGDCLTLVHRAFANYRKGDYAAAIEDCDAAVALKSGGTTALFIRGMAKAKSGDAAAGKADMDAAAHDESVVKMYGGFAAPQ